VHLCRLIVNGWDGGWRVGGWAVSGGGGGGGGLVGGGGREWVVYLMRVSYVCQCCNVRADTCRVFHLTTVRDGDPGVLSSTHAGAANSNDSQGARRAAVSGECGVCRFARACSSRCVRACKCHVSRRIVQSASQSVGR
jgi:hypothetical protein